MVAIAITAIVALLLDRISKIVMVNCVFNIDNLNMYSTAESIPVIKDVFHFSYLGNDGMAFGMFPNNKIFLIALCLVILTLIGFVIYRTKPEKNLEKISYGMIIGGAIGNLIDRIMHGFVIDFLDFRLINFPTFNVADCFVVVGAILLCVCVIFFDKKEDEVEKK